MQFTRTTFKANDCCSTTFTSLFSLKCPHHHMTLSRFEWSVPRPAGRRVQSTPPLHHRETENRVKEGKCWRRARVSAEQGSSWWLSERSGDIPSHLTDSKILSSDLGVASNIYPEINIWLTSSKITLFIRINKFCQIIP